LLVTIDTIHEAQKRISDVVVKTPFAYAPYLSEASSCTVYLKKENLQVTGAFKIRGAYNKISSLTSKQQKSGVVAASAGNHAQGVAFSAQKFGIKAVIIMPEATPLTKIDGVKYFGAEVILKGANYDEAYVYALEYGALHNLTLIHPFEDDKVISGQGTVALEMLSDIDDLDAIVVPVGGGGLISGIAVAAKSLKPSIQVIGVGAKGAPALKNSFDAKECHNSLNVRTIADGIAVRDCSEITLNYILKYVDKFISVDDAEIASAILYLLERQKLVVEGAGAVGVAALMHDELPELKGKKVAVVLSGGNMDVTLLSVIIEKGLIKSSRKMKLVVTLVDRPGSLMKLSAILKELDANIVHIAYDRTSISLEYGDANVIVHLETKGIKHQQLIMDVLQTSGYLSQSVV